MTDKRGVSGIKVIQELCLQQPREPRSVRPFFDPIYVVACVRFLYANIMAFVWRGDRGTLGLPVALLCLACLGGATHSLPFFSYNYGAYPLVIIPCFSRPRQRVGVSTGR